MNKEHKIDEWLQMNFPVGAGPEVIIGDDFLPSPNHYMTIHFGKDTNDAHFIIMETPEDKGGLRGNADTCVACFTMSKDLLLKIVRTINTSLDPFYEDENDNIPEW